jgi:hypothetical protein
MTVGVPALTQELRRAVCVHEAGHAVIAKLGGIAVYRVAVQPLGSPEWKIGVSADLMGTCQTPPWRWSKLITWLDDGWGFEADKTAFTTIPTEFYPADDTNRRAFAAEMRHAARAEVCCYLAGPIAEAIFTGDEAGAAGVLAWAENSYDPDDYGWARAIASVLPYRAELDHAVEVTERALRRPDIWGRVMRLADELERAGDIDWLLEWISGRDTGSADFLPKQEPGWPSSPGSAEGRRSEWRSRRKAKEARWRASRSGS